MSGALEDARGEGDNAVAGNPQLDWIDRYFSGANATRRFDGFGLSNDHNNDYFDTRFHPESTLTKACVKVEWVAFSEVAQDTPMIYVPCGISSGLRPHELLDRKNSNNGGTPGYIPAVSTYKAAEQIAEHGKMMLLNRDDNLGRARIVGRLHPESMVIAPVGREGSVREMNLTSAFSGNQHYEEEDFMALWFPVIDRCKGMMLDGDWNFSRNSIWEMMRGVLIQSGLVPSRAGADMDVFDLEGRPVTLLARTEKLAETLKYQLGKGFEPREAASALAQIFTLDDDIRSGVVPPEGAGLHSVLKYRPSEELRAMDALKAELKPILLKYCAYCMRLDDLPEDYREAASGNPQKMGKALLASFARFADAISARALEILSVNPSPSPEWKEKLDTASPPPMRVFDRHERFFEKDAAAEIFEDNLYSKLPEWERLALPFAIGAMETGLHPQKHPLATAVFTDLKRGREGFARAQDAGVQDMNEIAGALGRGMSNVIETNAREAETLKVKLKAENPGCIVVNTPGFLRIADAIERMRAEAGFIAAEGPSKTSPAARLALQMKYLDRDVDRAVFQDGWEYSSDLVQLRVRARLIQAGLVPRPDGVQRTQLRVSSAANPARCETLLDDLRLLTREVKRAVSAGVEMPEQAIALARLVSLHELLVDPSLQDMGGPRSRELINRQEAEDSMTNYNRMEARQVAEEAKGILRKKAAKWIPYERLYAPPEGSDGMNRAATKRLQKYLMEPYEQMRDSTHGKEGWAGRTSSHDEILINRSGVAR